MGSHTLDHEFKRMFVDECLLIYFILFFEIMNLWKYQMITFTNLDFKRFLTIWIKNLSFLRLLRSSKKICIFQKNININP